ncbi:MAG: hypothetical protein ACYDCQ_08580 [Dehalococcoidia bacterium]
MSVHILKPIVSVPADSAGWNAEDPTAAVCYPELAGGRDAGIVYAVYACLFDDRYRLRVSRASVTRSQGA